MAENESFEALAVQNKEQKRQGNEQNDGDFVGEELEGDCNEEEEEEEEKEEKENQLSELQQIVPNSQKEEEVREEQVETLTVAPQSSTEILPKENDRYSDDLAGLKGNSAAETHVEAEYKEQVGSSHQEVLGNVADKSSEAQTQNQLQPSLCPTSLSELSPTSVTQPISSAPSPSPAKKISPPEVKNAGITEAGDRSSAGLKALNVPVARTSIPDGYNWRKYGQKQVKSPKGSRSYYKCTYFDCCAKKIECSDHSGHVIEIVNKGMHCHDPPRKNKGTRKSRSGLSVGPILQTTVTEHTVRMLKDSEPDTLSMELVQETSAISERKRQSSSSSDESKETQIKEDNIGEPEPKRRLKGNLECSKSVLKPGKKPKFVVHAAGDVGITGDGYRWRKYGQKMVKGNPHPRNYYRCTSAGCPVRKHIETAVDNTNAVIITYKGVHDHDMPVPKKRHGPPSAPLVAAAAPAAMSNLPIKKTDAVQSQVTSTQWSVGKEGELTGETLDLGGEKEKAIESARTLLSIGFEIKPC